MKASRTAEASILSACWSCAFSFLFFACQRIQDPVQFSQKICYFVNFEIRWRHSADSETFIYFYQCSTLYFWLLISLWFFRSKAKKKHPLRMIAMRELFYYYFMRVEDEERISV